MKRKDLIEYGVIVATILILYATGWYRPVLGWMQQGILATGLFQPDLQLENPEPADYNLMLIDGEGNRVALSEFQGETVLINIWATWCPPCRAELPDMAKLYDTEEGENMRWIMISRDDDIQKAVDFFESKGYPWPVYQVAGAVPPAFQSQVVPTTFVISPEGKIVVRQNGMAKYNTRKFKRLIRSLNEGA